METYKIEYEAFLATYAKGQTNGEDVGAVIARMAQYYTELNIAYGKALMAYNVAARTIEESSDDETGKPISSSKAKVVAAATPQSEDLITVKVHLENIEQILNALKSLQRGIMFEMNATGHM